MAIWNAQVVFTAASGIPADEIVNTFNFEGGAGATDTANIDDMLLDFYTEASGTFPITAYYPSQAFSGDFAIRIYCQDDPMPRPPRAEYFHSFTPATGETLPHEVAFCLSYQAAPVAGQSQARRRGRVFLGPITEGQNDGGRPSQILCDNVMASAVDLLAAANASTTWQWIVWSRASAAGYDVVGGWTDDAWDTQRRRGVSATERYPWSV